MFVTTVKRKIGESIERKHILVLSHVCRPPETETEAASMWASGIVIVSCSE